MNLSAPWLSRLSGLVAVLISSHAQAKVPELADRPDRGQVVFAWAQNQDVDRMRHIRWHALTHLGTQFVTFDASANLGGVSSFLNRDADLKMGGAADENGVKLALVLANANFDETILDTIFQNPSLSTLLRQRVVDLATTTTNNARVHHVNLDFEFSWGTATRDGMMAFIRDLRSDLNARSVGLSIYTTPSWSSTRYDAATLRDYTDFVMPSGYDYASGLTATSVGRYGPASLFSILSNTDDYISAGIPPHKIVIALPLYSAAWTDTDPGLSYGDVATTSSGAESWLRSNFNPTYLLPTPLTKFNGTANHLSNWTRTESSPGVTRLVTFDDAVNLEHKMRMAKAWPGAVQTGRPLAGVAFWSLNWVTEANARDPNSPGTVQSLRRTASTPFSLMEELFSPPGQTRFRIDTFEGATTATTTGYSLRWRAANDGSDDSGIVSASRAMVESPAGGPAGDRRSLRFTTNFSSAGRGFIRYQYLLGDNAAPHSLDLNHNLVAIPQGARLRADIHVPAAYPALSVRLVVRDGDGEYERGPATVLSSAGWRTLEWDLTDASPGNVTGFSTTEGFQASGDGIIDSAGGGARDITVAGLELVASAAVNTQVDLALMEWEEAYPSARQYRINEYRYANTSAQFVEIFGPSGSIPAGLVLRSIRGSDGTTVSEVALSGTIPNDTGGGFGYYVVGSSGTANVDQVVAGSFFTTANPGALEIFEIPGGRQHDALVVEAHGGVGSIGIPGTARAADHGPGWQGEVANGGDSTGNRYTLGRYPDGAGSGSNEADFSPMPATPGGPNGNSILGAITYDFDQTTPTTQAYRTYNANTSGIFSTEIPPVGVNSSPNGGRVHRCVDTSGGGSVTFFGDSALGHNGNGADVRGQVFVGSTSQPQQAIGLGICVRSGSTFFSGSPTATGMDRGYWLVYENAAGVGLADGLPDAPGVWRFVYATNDGLGSAPQATVLGSASLATLGLPASGGLWTTFRLSVHRNAGGSNQLLASINGVEIYRGALPVGGPSSGPFALGFRENHSGPPVAVEGTWADNFQFGGTPVPVVLTGYSLDE
jgi:spore germination protein YaaH